jgi:hypothetical protein
MGDDPLRGEVTEKAEAFAEQERLNPATDEKALRKRLDMVIEEHMKLARAFDAVVSVYLGKIPPPDANIETIMAFKQIVRDLVGLMRDMLNVKDAQK